jgi:hypothetical protein
MPPSVVGLKRKLEAANASPNAAAVDDRRDIGLGATTGLVGPIAATSDLFLRCRRERPLSR